MTFQRTPEDHKRHYRQKDLVLQHLQAGKPITQDIARAEYGVMRLASRVSELKKQGHCILSLRHEHGYAVYLLLGSMAEGGRE